MSHVRKEVMSAKEKHWRETAAQYKYWIGNRKEKEEE
jgi:hypothetical protein